MPVYRTKLVDGAFEKAQGRDLNVSLFESEERYEQRLDDDGYVTLRKREFDRLRLAGLVEDATADPLAENEPEDDDPSTRARTQVTGRLQTLPVPTGPVGHQEGDGFGQEQIHRELAQLEERGRALRDEKGLDTNPDDDAHRAHRRSIGALPEQVKEHQKAERERDQAIEKARKEGAKDREKERREAEREQEKADRENEREQKKSAKDEDKPDAGAVKDEGEDNQPTDGEPKAHAKQRSGAAKRPDESRSQRDEKVKNALKTDDKNDDKQGS